MAVGLFSVKVVIVFIISEIVLTKQDDLLEKIRVSKANEPEVNDFLKSVLRHKDDFRWIRNIAAKKMRHNAHLDDYNILGEDNSIKALSIKLAKQEYPSFASHARRRSSNRRNYNYNRPINDAYPYSSKYSRFKRSFEHITNDRKEDAKYSENSDNDDESAVNVITRSDIGVQIAPGSKYELNNREDRECLPNHDIHEYVAPAHNPSIENKDDNSSIMGEYYYSTPHDLLGMAQDLRCKVANRSNSKVRKEAVDTSLQDEQANKIDRSIKVNIVDKGKLIKAVEQNENSNSLVLTFKDDSSAETPKNIFGDISRPETPIGTLKTAYPYISGRKAIINQAGIAAGSNSPVNNGQVNAGQVSNNQAINNQVNNNQASNNQVSNNQVSNNPFSNNQVRNNEANLVENPSPAKLNNKAENNNVTDDTLENIDKILKYDQDTLKHSNYLPSYMKIKKENKDNSINHKKEIRMTKEIDYFPNDESLLVMDRSNNYAHRQINKALDKRHQYLKNAHYNVREDDDESYGFRPPIYKLKHKTKSQLSHSKVIKDGQYMGHAHRQDFNRGFKKLQNYQGANDANNHLVEFEKSKEKNYHILNNKNQFEEEQILANGIEEVVTQDPPLNKKNLLEDETEPTSAAEQRELEKKDYEKFGTPSMDPYTTEKMDVIQGAKVLSSNIKKPIEEDTDVNIKEINEDYEDGLGGIIDLSDKSDKDDKTFRVKDAKDMIHLKQKFKKSKTFNDDNADIVNDSDSKYKLNDYDHELNYNLEKSNHIKDKMRKSINVEDEVEIKDEVNKENDNTNDNAEEYSVDYIQAFNDDSFFEPQAKLEIFHSRQLLSLNNQDQHLDLDDQIVEQTFDNGLDYQNGDTNEVNIRVKRTVPNGSNLENTCGKSPNEENNDYNDKVADEGDDDLEYSALGPKWKYETKHIKEIHENFNLEEPIEGAEETLGFEHVPVCEIRRSKHGENSKPKSENSESMKKKSTYIHKESTNKKNKIKKMSTIKSKQSANSNHKIGKIEHHKNDASKKDNHIDNDNIVIDEEPKTIVEIKLKNKDNSDDNHAYNNDNEDQPTKNKKIDQRNREAKHSNDDENYIDEQLEIKERKNDIKPILKNKVLNHKSIVIIPINKDESDDYSRQPNKNSKNIKVHNGKYAGNKISKMQKLYPSKNKLKGIKNVEIMNNDDDKENSDENSDDVSKNENQNTKHNNNHIQYSGNKIKTLVNNSHKKIHADVSDNKFNDKVIKEQLLTKDNIKKLKNNHLKDKINFKEGAVKYNNPINKKNSKNKIKSDDDKRSKVKKDETITFDKKAVVLKNKKIDKSNDIKKFNQESRVTRENHVSEPLENYYNVTEEIQANGIKSPRESIIRKSNCADENNKNGLEIFEQDQALVIRFTTPSSTTAKDVQDQEQEQDEEESESSPDVVIIDDELESDLRPPVDSSDDSNRKVFQSNSTKDENTSYSENHANSNERSADFSDDTQLFDKILDVMNNFHKSKTNIKSLDSKVEIEKPPVYIHNRSLQFGDEDPNFSHHLHKNKKVHPPPSVRKVCQRINKPRDEPDEFNEECENKLFEEAKIPRSNQRDINEIKSNDDNSDTMEESVKVEKKEDQNTQNTQNNSLDSVDSFIDVIETPHNSIRSKKGIDDYLPFGFENITQEEENEKPNIRSKRYLKFLYKDDFNNTEVPEDKKRRRFNDRSDHFIANSKGYHRQEKRNLEYLYSNNDNSINYGPLEDDIYNLKMPRSVQSVKQNITKTVKHRKNVEKVTESSMTSLIQNISTITVTQKTVSSTNSIEKQLDEPKHRKKPRPSAEDIRRKERERMKEVMNGQLIISIMDVFTQKLKENDRVYKRFGKAMPRKRAEILVQKIASFRDEQARRDIKHAEVMLHQVIVMLNRVVTDQVHRRTCIMLSPDLKEYLTMVTSQTCKKNMNNQIAEGYPLPALNGTNGSIPSNQPPPPDEDQEDFLFDNNESGDAGHGKHASSDPHHIAKKINFIKKLLNKYNHMTQSCQVKVEPVKNYLLDHLDMLEKLKNKEDTDAEQVTEHDDTCESELKGSEGGGESPNNSIQNTNSILDKDQSIATTVSGKFASSTISDLVSENVSLMPFAISSTVTSNVKEQKLEKSAEEEDAEETEAVKQRLISSYGNKKYVAQIPKEINPILEGIDNKNGYSDPEMVDNNLFQLGLGGNSKSYVPRFNINSMVKSNLKSDELTPISSDISSPVPLGSNYISMQPSVSSGPPAKVKRDTDEEDGDWEGSEKYQKLVEAADDFRRKREVEDRLGKYFSSNKEFGSESAGVKSNVQEAYPDLSKVQFEKPIVYRVA